MKKRLPLILLCIVLAAAIITCGIIFNPFKSDAGKHIEMGQRYLDELQWESALAEFELALEIDPRSVEARLGAAEAYIGLGQYADAVRVLADGYILTGDERLKAALNDERLAEDLDKYMSAYLKEQLNEYESGESGAGGDDTETTDAGTVSTEPTVTATRTYPDDEVIVWKDAVFESIIREYLGKPEGDIVYADVKEIYAIVIDGLSKEYIIDSHNENYDIFSGEITGEIQSIADIKYFTSLSVLDLTDNNISDISPLAELTNLTLIFISYNNISDISPLANLTALTSLLISDNNISDISPLANLTALTSLDISHNDISDISPLAKLTALTYLDIGESNVSDISPLANLTALETLDISLTNVTDISPLAGLTNLKVLYLYETPVTDLSPLDGIEGLEILQ